MNSKALKEIITLINLIKPDIKKISKKSEKVESLKKDISSLSNNFMLLEYENISIFFNKLYKQINKIDILNDDNIDILKTISIDFIDKILNNSDNIEDIDILAIESIKNFDKFILLNRSISKELKILIVEDDIISRNLLINLLKKYGEIDIAVNGKEAFEIFKYNLDRSIYYNLICLDIMMPKMDGIEFLKEVRKYEKKIEIPSKNRSKIVMTTALKDTKTVIESFRENCDGYIVKPIRKDNLKSTLKKIDIYID